MGWLLLLQGGLFTALAFLIASFPGIQLRYALEAFMLCIICPTATACAVVTGKLGGNMAGVVTYTVLINLLVSVLVPLTVPLIHPIEGMSFWKSFLLIISRGALISVTGVLISCATYVKKLILASYASCSWTAFI